MAGLLPALAALADGPEKKPDQVGLQRISADWQGGAKHPVAEAGEV
jgi:hypothetical protein